MEPDWPQASAAYLGVVFDDANHGCVGLLSCSGYAVLYVE